MYEYKKSCFNSYLMIHKYGGIKVGYKMLSPTTLKHMRNENSRIQLINPVGNIVNSVKPIGMSAVFAYAPDKQLGIVLSDVRLKSHQVNKLITRLKGAGTGVIYGRILVNNQICPRRTRFVLLNGSGRKINILNKIPKKRVLVRLRISSVNRNSLFTHLVKLPQTRRGRQKPLGHKELRSLCQQLTRD
jgi:hypothetical protein